MAYTPKQAKRIRRQYRRIVGAKPKGPKTMEIRGRRGAVQRCDSSFVNKAGKVVPPTRRKRLKTMERVIASGKKPVRKPVRTPVKGLKKPKMTQPGILNPKLSKNDPTAFKRPKRRNPGNTFKGQGRGRVVMRPLSKAPARRRNRRKTR